MGSSAETGLHRIPAHSVTKALEGIGLLKSIVMYYTTFLTRLSYDTSPWAGRLASGYSWLGNVSDLDQPFVTVEQHGHHLTLGIAYNSAFHFCESFRGDSDIYALINE